MNKKSAELENYEAFDSILERAVKNITSQCIEDESAKSMNGFEQLEYIMKFKFRN